MSKQINSNLNKQHSSNNQGFTLIELMIVIFIIAIITAIVLPSYQSYSRKAARSQAQQEILKLAEQLERHRVKNYTYSGFSPAYLYGKTGDLDEIIIPVGATGDRIKYKIQIRDLNQTSKLLTSADVRGLGWVIKADSTDNKNYNLLMTSTGMRCSTTTSIAFDGCGTGDKVETW